MPKLPETIRYDTVGGVRIYRIACRVFEYLTARVYLILGAGPPTLVDTGSGHGQSTEQILAGIEQVHAQFGEPIRPADIRRILITHGHVDHIGGLRQLLESTNAEVGIHPLDARAVTAPEERTVLAGQRLDAFLRRAGVSDDLRAKLTGDGRYQRQSRPSRPNDIPLEDGLQLDGLRFFHVPGHAPGHVCIRIDNVLLCGDHVLARTLPQQWPESMIPHTGLDHYLASLAKIRGVEGIDFALPAHEPVIEDVHPRIDAIRRSQFRRLDRVLGILRKAEQPLSISEISRRMYADKKGIHVLLALCDTGARVEYLHQRGQVLVANLDELEKQRDAVCKFHVP